MSYILEVHSLGVCRFESPAGPKLLVQALGEVPTTDWVDIRLAPRFAATTPPTGLMEFDFKGRSPLGLVLDCSVTVAASIVVGMPSWFRGVKIHASTNSLYGEQVHFAEELLACVEAVQLPMKRRAGHSRTLAVYEDRFQSDGGWHGQCLRHELTISLSGPEGARIGQCVTDVSFHRLVGPIGPAYSQGGEALSAAIASLLHWLHQQLGSAYAIQIEDRAQWVAADSMRDGLWP